jgi:hypothetical protein
VTSAAPADAATRHAIIAGDVLIDRHLYTGDRPTPTVEGRRGVCEKTQAGGAHLLCALIETLFTLDRERRPGAHAVVWKALPAVEAPDLKGRPGGHDGYAIWRPYPLRRDQRPDDPARVWRASDLLGYGDRCEPLAPPKAVTAPDPDLLVFDDAGALFRDAAGHGTWDLAERGTGFVLLKMSEPLTQGALWRRLAAACPDRLVCLVGARDLRREALALGEGLSWEATLDDLRLALQSDPVARRLTACRHLVVTFSSDAALWLDLTDKSAPIARLILDPARAEGEWANQFEGEAFGFHCAMAGALALGLADHADKAVGPGDGLDLTPAMEAGLLAMRDLRRFGHGKVMEGKLPGGFPVQPIATRILDVRDAGRPGPDRLARLTIAWPAGPSQRDWSLVEAQALPSGDGSRRPLLGLARRIAQHGTGALTQLPHARFGKLLSLDRAEIETLRHIRRRMQLYRDIAAPPRPLSIGVFGPPGAGKSFGVKQLAREVFGDKAWLDFNLSQFGTPADLIGAFHQVRDRVLSGVTPVVMWDEFDSKDLDWLQFLLAPMQDGRFQEGPLNHAIGKAVFVFAGGTSWSFAEFTPGPARDADFRRRKGPDFVSRLDAHMNVLGPNPRTLPTDAGGRVVDPADIGYPLRRALLIRANLGCETDEAVDIDPNVLHALLAIDRYRHGARSLEKLIDLIRGPAPRQIRRSNLPRPAQLDMHVDAAAFARLLNGEAVAAAIHDTWRDLSKTQGWSMHPDLDKPYADLAEADKDINRAAAERMGELLALVGLALRPAEDSEEPAAPAEEVRQRLRDGIETLAEAEHEGWRRYMESNGWRLGAAKSREAKTHPGLVPYGGLGETDREKDRDSVRHYPDFALRANHRIVRAP